MASPRIEEESLKSVLSKIGEESNSSKRMNLAKSTIIEPPKLVSSRQPPMETDNLGVIVVTIIENSDGIWRRMDRDHRMAYTNDDIEAINENIAYLKHIRDSEIETRKVFERETSNKNIENIGTRLDKT